MINLVQDIITRFGPRLAGSQAEKDAQLFIKDKCKQHTNDTKFMPFEAYLDARFGKLRYFVGLYVIALIIYWISYFFKVDLYWVALIISFVNTVFLVVDFLMYRSLLPNFPGKKQRSWNVEATLEPELEVKSTMIISGHMDSTREYTWWYKLGVLGKQLTVYAGVLMLLQFVILVVLVFFNFNEVYVWITVTALSPILIVYWSMQGEEGVPGAHDNLSGITIAYHLFEALSNPDSKGKTILKNTRIRFVSFGSEERGLCGAQAYLAEYYEKIKAENTWILNFDSIRTVDKLAVVKSESAGTKHHPSMVKELKQSFEELEIPCNYTHVPIGGMDTTPFARKGIPTVSMIGIDTKDVYYHTRNDTVENMEPEVLENTFKGALHFIKQWDKKTEYH